MEAVIILSRICKRSGGLVLFVLACSRLLGCYSYSGADPEKFKSDSMIGVRIKITNTSNLSFTPLALARHCIILIMHHNWNASASENASGWKWMKVDESEWNWMKVDESGWKWMTVDESGWKWIKVNESGWKWMKEDERGWNGWNICNGWKWMKLDDWYMSDADADAVTPSSNTLRNVP